MTMHTDPELHGPPRGSLIGPWRVLERANSGSFGIIYRVALASNPTGLYALKLAAQPWDARFEREAELLSRVDSPHLPRFHDAGIWETPSGRRHPYVVMAWVEGVPLYPWARAMGRRLTSRIALQLLAQVARALEAVHAHGLHRDVKGDNVLVAGDGRAVLLDVGACWLPDGRLLTESCLPPGTPQYRSPEAIDFRERFRQDWQARYQSRPQDDVYALGVMAYRLVTGHYPPEPMGSGRFVPPSALVTVAPELEALILQMLSPKWEARGTARELAHALERAAEGEGLDAPVSPSSSVLPTEHTCFRGVWAWRARALARVASPLAVVAAAALMLFVLDSSLGHPPEGQATPEVTLLPMEWQAPPMHAADAGVVEEALLSVVRTPRPGSPAHVLGLPLPKTPLPGQKKPPCEPDYEVAAIGACWYVFAKKPPCGPRSYDLDGKCVRASFDAPRQPTSEQP